MSVSVRIVPGCFQIALFVAIGVCGLSTTTTVRAQTDSTLTRVRLSGVEQGQAEFALYYSPGYGERAEKVSRLLSDADEFLRDSLGVRAEIALAVLAEPEWQAVWPGPYGIPYLSLGRPWVVVVPAEPANSVVFPGISQAVGHAGASTMIDNIGFHEVGHAYISEYLYPQSWTDAPPVRWLDEFFAQYLAYAFLSTVSPERAAVWDDYTRLSLEAMDPPLKSLEEFDREYYGYLLTEEGSANYAWYQSVFAKRAAEVYRVRGIGFLRDVKEQLNWSRFADWTTKEVLSQLNEIVPGFAGWAPEADE